MNCDEINELLAAYALDALEDGETAAVREHIETCRRHDEALAELQDLVARLPLAVEDREPPAVLRSRLLEAFDAEAGASNVTPIANARVTRFAPPALRYLAAAAVLVLAIVGLAVWNVILQTGDEGESTMVVQLVGETGSGKVLYVPDEQVAVMQLDLPELPSGREYQAWLIDGDDKHSLGMVPGDGTVAMDIDLTGADAVAVTDEPAGGSDQPTTTPLVVADLT
jgi:anti-sigma-K factor RskA